MNLNPAGACRRTGKTIRTFECPSTFSNGDNDFRCPAREIAQRGHEVRRDPQERGYIDIVEYYDDSGKLIREVRQK